MTETTARTDWAGWQRGWDRQQEWYMPDREERFRVMLDMVEAVVGREPRVLDLACGTGSITGRVLRRFPGARTTGVDRDPVLLAIARGHFADEPRASFVTADLLDPDWTALLPHEEYDAVLTATALHWMRAEPLRGLYARLAGIVRPGGVLMNADHMPDGSTPRIDAAVRAHERARQDREREAGVRDWAGWWADVAEDPALGELAAERFALFGDPAAGDHADGESQPAAWHARTLLAAGFAEARPVWCSATDALVLGLR
ncbi:MULTISPECIES: trans-aconitate 2-methyltransferase [unclassified Streptomyces]|uniref:class I SAM-dependent methyltransferase n=1 Tax=unclassified Streptomyces TaxID=2593676 RepID=UPI000BF9E62C|nr:class I SAM-dependent methyltransferase [Streptomyces sp. Ru87]PGH52312.1 SAM-dependent methyltransferase [Streptomyces sp. Ru87]